MIVANIYWSLFKNNQSTQSGLPKTIFSGLLNIPTIWNETFNTWSNIETQFSLINQIILIEKKKNWQETGEIFWMD